MRSSLVTPTLLLLLLIAPAMAESPRVRVGSKSFTESVILGEIVTQMAASTGADAEHRSELGGTQILWSALQSGEIDVYPEYTGTLRMEILSGESLHTDEELRQAVEKRGLRMGGWLGFSNTYALGMRDDAAARLKIQSLADLAQHPELKCGFSDEFVDRPDGWPGLKQTYKLALQDIRVLDHTLAYRGLETGSLDVMDLFSTDPEIRQLNLRVLEDTRGYFPPYQAVLLWRADLETRAPEVVVALKRLEGMLETPVVMELNGQAKLDHVPEARVAAQYLQKTFGLALKPQESQQSRMIRSLLANTTQHLFLTGISLTAAVLVAIPLGIAAAYRPRLGVAVMGIVGIIQTLPSMALLVFMIPFLGLGARPAIVALFLYSLLPIVRNTATGLTGISPGLRESAEALGLSAWSRLWRVELPLASPAILSGIKTAAVINVGTATIGALIGAGGLGQPILTGIRLNHLNLILQGAIPAALLALAVQGIFSLAERYVVPRGLRL